MRSTLLSACCLFIFPLFGMGQVLINEVSSANESIIEDINGKYSDWIEFYNPGPNPVDMSGYTITSSEDYEVTWTFPSVIIKPNDVLLVFCPAQELSILIDHIEIPTWPGDTWSYQTNDSPYDPNWVNQGFNDASWATGPTGIGTAFNAYDSSFVSTVIDTAGIGFVKSLFLRKEIQVPDPGKVSFGLLFNVFDDGMVAYVNGVEIGRYNQLGFPPVHGDLAISDIEPGIEIPYFIDPSVFVQGTNTLAVQVHNADSVGGFIDNLFGQPYMLLAMNDTTITLPEPLYPAPIYLCDKGLHTNFNLSSTGQVLTLRNASGSIVDTMRVGTIQTNHSRGRYPDGAADFFVFDAPSPCNTNTISTPYTGYAGAPVITPDGGAFDTDQTVTMEVPGSTTASIVWTWEGTEPVQGVGWPVYNGPFTFDSTLVLRARNFDSDPNLLPSTITTATFINEDITLPIVSITTDPFNLWDWNEGIYVMGPNAAPDPPFNGANFTQGWEKPAHVEYFTKEKSLDIDVDCKVKIHGNFSKSWPQKSFRLLANDDYGVKAINYDKLFPNKTVKRIKSFNVRNAGIDWNTCHFRDGFMNLAAKGLHMDYMDFQPCVVLVNGDYFGVFGLRERQDENYIAQNNNVRPDQVDLLRFEGDALHGSNAGFFSMVDFIENSDLAVDSTYAYVRDSLIDVVNVADYFITETFYSNFDWVGEAGSNNIKFWRTHTPAGKWRYVLWDTDLGTGLANSIITYDYDHLGEILGYTNSNHIKVLTGLLENPGYENYFINRYADLVNTTFHSSVTNELVDQIVDEMTPEMARHFAMWGNPVPINIFGILDIGRAYDVPSWLNEVNALRDFINNRPVYALNFVESNFGMTKQVDVTLDVYPENAGTIQMNTIVPDSLPWTGVYFDGNEVTMTATPAEGYRFTHWEANNNMAIDSSASIQLNVASDDQFVAHFEEITTSLQVHPNPFSTNLEIQFSLPEDATQVKLRLHDVYGNIVADILSSGRFMNSGDHVIQYNINKRSIPIGMYFLTLEAGDFNETIKVVKYE